MPFSLVHSESKQCSQKCKVYLRTFDWTHRTMKHKYLNLLLKTTTYLLTKWQPTLVPNATQNLQQFFLSSSIPRLCSLTWQSSQGVVSFLPKQGQTDNGTYKKFSQSSFKKLFHFYEKYRSGQLSRYMYLYVIPGSMLTAFIMKPTFVVFVLSLCFFLEKNTCSVILKQIHTQHTGFFFILYL